MASYDKSINSAYTANVQSILAQLGADLGAGGIDGKWGAYTQRAYQQNKAAVDAALNGNALYGGYDGSGGLPQLKLQTVELPTSHGYEYFYSIGDALEAAQYERQRAKAENGLTQAKQTLSTELEQTKANAAAAANARGFGRSTYVTDTLQYADQAAMAQKQALESEFTQTLLRLDAERHAGAAAYASKAYQAQEDRALQASIANTKAANEFALAQWKAQVDQLSKSNTQAASASKKSTGSSRKNTTASSAASPSPTSQNKGSTRVTELSGRNAIPTRIYGG